MGKDFNEWPTIEGNEITETPNVVSDGFSPEPDPSQYIVTQQETSPVAPKVGIEIDSSKIDRLSDTNIAPKITDTETVFSGQHHESGVKSTLMRSGFDNEPSGNLTNIPKGFKAPAPVRAPRVEEQKSLLRRLFGG